MSPLRVPSPHFWQLYDFESACFWQNAPHPRVQDMHERNFCLTHLEVGEVTRSYTAANKMHDTRRAVGPRGDIWLASTPTISKPLSEGPSPSSFFCPLSSSSDLSHSANLPRGKSASHLEDLSIKTSRSTLSGWFFLIVIFLVVFHSD